MKLTRRDGLTLCNGHTYIHTQRILSDPDVVKSYAGRPTHRCREAYQAELRANTIQRFLDIVLLLDR